MLLPPRVRLLVPGTAFEGIHEVSRLGRVESVNITSMISLDLDGLAHTTQRLSALYTGLSAMVRGLSSAWGIGSVGVGEADVLWGEMRNRSARWGSGGKQGGAP